jgi:restriction system protein
MADEGNGRVTWCIRAGRDDTYREQFLDPQRPVVALGWCEQEDLSGHIATRDAFNAAVAAYYPDFAPASVARAAGQLFRFVHEMRPGDFVVYPELAGGSVHCGRVEGPYTYREGIYPRHHSLIAPHLHAVTWYQVLPRTAFVDEEHRALSVRLTLSVLTRESLLRHCFPDRNPAVENPPTR